MIKAPERIWAMAPGLGHLRRIGTYIDKPDEEYRTEYIRADLVEAAIKRALEGAAKAGERFDGPVSRSNFVNGQATASQQIMAAIRAIDPAQFIEGQRP